VVRDALPVPLRRACARHLKKKFSLEQFFQKKVLAKTILSFHAFHAKILQYTGVFFVLCADLSATWKFNFQVLLPSVLIWLYVPYFKQLFKIRNNGAKDGSKGGAEGGSGKKWK